MFTGLIEELGTLARRTTRGSGIELAIAAPAYARDATLGESIAVNGCCLTVERTDGDALVFFATPETLNRTSLGAKAIGDAVNLERAMALGDRLGGHLVQGHVDAVGALRSVRATGDAWEVWFDAPATILDHSVEKGSIAVDGISLTIAALDAAGFSVWIIPETWRRTTLSSLKPGDAVNLESDLIGKYVARLMAGRGAGAAASLEATWAKYRGE